MAVKVGKTVQFRTRVGPNIVSRAAIVVRMQSLTVVDLAVLDQASGLVTVVLRSGVPFGNGDGEWRFCLNDPGDLP